MPGGQSRGLIQASITKGWDPRVIPARADRPSVDLSKWDVDPTSATTRYVGRLTGGTPDVFASDNPAADGYHDIFAEPSFNHPDTRRETVSRGVRETLPVREPSDLFRGGGR